MGRYIGASADTDAIEYLTPRQRVIVQLYYEEGWNQAEIGRIIGWSQFVVFKDLRQAAHTLWQIGTINSASILVPSRVGV